ncbi:MAG: hypothetical protein HeimC2_22820 [Candidatus Heimdallarchaeota archaeon LC_2]|nr:MAG: hypothetical protein HeimC2_22820 [Candidatus Heimdallarchaeota archaeon LC_2]
MKKRQILVLIVWVNTLFLTSLIPNIISQETSGTEPINDKFTVEWYHTFGGSNDELAYSLVQALDGGFGIVGSTESYGGGESDLYLVKTDSKGNFQWDYVFGSPYYERAQDVIMTPDGGFVILGEFSDTPLYGGTHSNFLIELDKEGVMRWNQSYQESEITNAAEFVQTSDGGYVLAGASFPDISLLKTNAVGIKQWNQTYKSPDREFINNTIGIRTKLVQVSDGGFIITVDPTIYTGGPPLSDHFILKTDNNGAMQWNKTFGSKVQVNDLTPTSDGGFVIFGEIIQDEWEEWIDRSSKCLCLLVH